MLQALLHPSAEIGAWQPNGGGKLVGATARRVAQRKQNQLF